MAADKNLSDQQIFEEALAVRSEDRAAADRLLGELATRWQRPACYVIRKIQSSYGKGSPDDELELYQEALRRLIERGLDQYRGVSEMTPGRAASPKTFFLRIVKHLTIDHYRRQREELVSPPTHADDAPEISAPEANQSMTTARRVAERAEAHELYWVAYARLSREHPNEAEAWDVYHHQDADGHEACAKQLGISVANSYKRISRAQAHLRLYLLELRDA